MSTVLSTQASNELDDFVALSAILTGIAAGQLKPLLDTHGTAQTYLDVVKQNAAQSFSALMQVFDTNRAKPSDQIAAAIFGAPQLVADTARSIMLLWYLASWYDPAQMPGFRANPTVPMNFTVVSSDAYTQGWVWRVGQTHPMGYSNWRFGYWNSAPPALSQFIGGGSQ